MIKITPKDLMDILPDLINLFLSGFIFMSTYNWLNNKTSNISTITLWSLFISALIKSLLSVMHYYILPTILFPDALKILIYSLFGVVLAFVAVKVKKSHFIEMLLYNVANKSINSDIFDDVIDYDRKTILTMYLKSSDVYYIGRFLYREEKGLDSWIVLADYCRVESDTNKVLFEAEESNIRPVALVNLRDVERIEIMYDEDSKIWDKFTK